MDKGEYITIKGEQFNIGILTLGEMRDMKKAKEDEVKIMAVLLKKPEEFVENINAKEMKLVFDVMQKYNDMGQE